MMRQLTMDSERITLMCAAKSIVVTPGRAIRARLHYQAPGLEIYVTGLVSASQLHLLHYQACAEAQARNIPLISLKNVYDCGCAKKRVSDKQKRLLE